MASRYLINCSVIDTNLILKRPFPCHRAAVTSYDSICLTCRSFSICCRFLPQDLSLRGFSPTFLFSLEPSLVYYSSLRGSYKLSSNLQKVKFIILSWWKNSLQSYVSTKRKVFASCNNKEMVIKRDGVIQGQGGGGGVIGKDTFCF